MKYITIAIIAAVGITGVARAGEGQSLEAVDVTRSAAMDCTPPNDHADCAAWHEQIRRNFRPREIGMLFGAATAYPEYKTSYARVKARYDRLKERFSATPIAQDAVASRK